MKKEQEWEYYIDNYESDYEEIDEYNSIFNESQDCDNYNDNYYYSSYNSFNNNNKLNNNLIKLNKDNNKFISNNNEAIKD